MKKLSLCIPTYNRSGCLEKLLDFLKKEIDNSGNPEDIEIIISNNCSQDNTEEVVLNSDIYVDEKYDVKYIKNEYNKGLAGNLETVYKAASAEYVWLWGDDDNYHEGILSKVFSYIKNGKYDYIFINHSIWVYSKKGTRSGFGSVIGDVNVDRECKEVLIDIFLYSGTSMMFISACVHKNANIKKALNEYPIDMAYPLFLSFYSAASGKNKIIPEVLIDDVVESISWGDNMKHLFQVECPAVLEALRNHGYNNVIVDRMLKSYRKRMGLLWYQKITKKYKLNYPALALRKVVNTLSKWIQA